MALILGIYAIEIKGVDNKENLECRSGIKDWDIIKNRGNNRGKRDIEGIGSVEAMESIKDLETRVVVNNKGIINDKSGKKGWCRISRGI